MVNEKKQTAIETNNKLIGHLDKSKDNYLVMDALSGKDSFKGSVANFYDICVFDFGKMITSPFGGCVVPIYSSEYIFLNKSPEKKGSSPKDLIEVLNPFAEKILEASKLGYDSVRKNCDKWYQIPRDFLSLIGIGIHDKNMEEFWHLYTAAHNADNFMKMTYLPYFIKGALEKNEK